MSWEEWGIVAGVGALLIVLFVSLEILFPASTAILTEEKDAEEDHPVPHDDSKHAA